MEVEDHLNEVNGVIPLEDHPHIDLTDEDLLKTSTYESFTKGEISAAIGKTTLLGKPESISCPDDLKDRMIEKIKQDQAEGYDDNNPRPGTLSAAIKDLETLLQIKLSGSTKES